MVLKCLGACPEDLLLRGEGLTEHPEKDPACRASGSFPFRAVRVFRRRTLFLAHPHSSRSRKSQSAPAVAATPVLRHASSTSKAGVWISAVTPAASLATPRRK